MEILGRSPVCRQGLPDMVFGSYRYILAVLQLERHGIINVKGAEGCQNEMVGLESASQFFSMI